MSTLRFIIASLLFFIPSTVIAASMDGYPEFIGPATAADFLFSWDDSSETGSSKIMFPGLDSHFLNGQGEFVLLDLTESDPAFVAWGYDFDDLVNVPSFSTQLDALTDITGDGTTDYMLYDDGDGTFSFRAAPTGGGDALVANPLSQFAPTTSAQFAGVVSDETGTGSVVLATSPTLVTPALGTPSALVLTNATGVPSDSTPLSAGTGITFNVGEISVTAGTYEPADATILKDADIGVTVLAPDGDGSSLTGISASVTEQAADPTSASSVGFYGATTSGGFFYKSSTGLFDISAGTYTLDPATADWTPYDIQIYEGGGDALGGDYKVMLYNSVGNKVLETVARTFDRGDGLVTILVSGTPTDVSASSVYYGAVVLDASASVYMTYATGALAWRVDAEGGSYASPTATVVVDPWDDDQGYHGELIMKVRNAAGQTLVEWAGTDGGEDLLSVRDSALVYQTPATSEASL